MDLGGWGDRDSISSKNKLFARLVQMSSQTRDTDKGTGHKNDSRCEFSYSVDIIDQLRLHWMTRDREFRDVRFGA